MTPATQTPSPGRAHIVGRPVLVVADDVAAWLTERAATAATDGD
jgi:hypothetical protein